MAERIYAFDAYAAGQTSGGVAAGVTLEPRRVAVMLNVRGRGDDAALARAVLDRFGVALPREPNTTAGTDAARALWLGPDEWLLVLQPEGGEAAFMTGEGTLTDVSHGRAALRLSGLDVREALAKGCALDLHPLEFPPGRCAQTAIAKVSVLLDHVQPGVFDLYCSRSYAGSLWQWLTDACAEFRCNVSPPV